MLRFMFFENTDLDNLQEDCEAYCKKYEIGTKHKLVKIYNHSLFVPSSTILNKVMVVWDDNLEDSS